MGLYAVSEIELHVLLFESYIVHSLLTVQDEYGLVTRLFMLRYDKNK